MINDATKMNAEEGSNAEPNVSIYSALVFVKIADSSLMYSLQDRLLKPLGGYLGYNNEWRDLAQVISRVSETMNGEI